MPPRDRVLAADERRSGSAGIACDTDYAGRSLKGQRTQASRTGARTVVIARSRRRGRAAPGEDDRVVALADLAATLSR